MINAGFVDFAFTGAGLVPSLLMMAGYFAEALFLLVPMLIGACLLSQYWEHCLADESSPDELQAGTEESQQQV